MDTGGRKLEHTQVRILNKSAIPMKLEWIEALGKGGMARQTITKNIEPGEFITVELGEQGAYLPGWAKVEYSPIPGNETFKQKFVVDLPSSQEFVFTTVNLADVLKNILIPGVLKVDDQGNLGSFQFQNLHHPSYLDNAMKAVGFVKSKPQPKYRSKR